MTRYRPGPRAMTIAFEALREDLAPDTLLAAVQRVWPEVVGPAIAAEASPTAERAGVLTISCAAAVWAQELDLMAPAILGRLNQRLERAAASSARARPGASLTAAAPSSQPVRRPGSGPSFATPGEPSIKRLRCVSI